MQLTTTTTTNTTTTTTTTTPTPTPTTTPTTTCIITTTSTIATTTIITMIIEWLRLCRRPLLSTDAIRYCLLLTSDRCLEGGRDRNGARDDFVFTSCQMLFAKCRWKEKVKQTERSTMFYGY